jgi:L-fuconolactonase
MMSEENPRRPTPPHLFVDNEWLAQRTEEVIDPDRPIVDAHHHLWAVQAPYMVDELRADLQSGHMIRGSVFIECSFMYRAEGDKRFASLGEIEYVNGVAASFASGYYGPTRACAAIVGKVDLRQGAAAEEVLRAALARAPDRLRGIRHMCGWDASPEVHITRFPAPRHLMLDPTFREGFAKLAPLGLSYEAQCHHPQLPELIDLVDAFPNTLFVANHLAGLCRIGPYAEDDAENLRYWKSLITDLAKRPNVMMKVGGLGMRWLGFGFMDRKYPPTSIELAAAWKPLAETCIEVFGTKRTMFESNFPVDKTSCSYRALWNAYKRITSEYSESEKADLFAETAIRTYRLPAELGQPA